VLLINFGYLITMETLTRGRTVGAYALGPAGGARRRRVDPLPTGPDARVAFWAVDFAIWTASAAG
jgi:hypothetical protein